ncbi:tyrosine-type recombinase/integrase [Ornithinimicrobium cryptoxanthini]|uniref:Tyrosine-type recombinase/integrase n=1 Tax=Ornithinimicrobium cryptoxanthini TaxID=2934161 RepID=A0ABY4YHK8_9MICO|nr:tyrosine-type recombinase/integrase [Ornithinimicrobium cryptoxanthini]USQ76099.1 tyrosine-type recombinase/integrase [Ornithinimicrobium cryptoxanthini]
MSTLQEHLTEYLAMRRALGYDLSVLEHRVGQFLSWLTAQGKETFTTADAVTWARLPADADPRWWGMRLGAVRTFAKYLDAIGVDVQVPPRGVLPAGPRRAAPFIYTQADLDALLDTCPQVFTRQLQAATMRTVIALLAATGMRIGEALRLTPADIDTATGVLTIRASKRKDRLVPVHPTTLEALKTYGRLPARSATRPATDAPLLVSSRGTGYHRSTIEAYFARVVTTAGLLPRGAARPRLHDLRHTFATGHMAAAYADGGDPQRTLTLLATWLGHTSTTHTYWYLSATPELMFLAATRLNQPKEPS